jgi:hypothetical protein
MPEQVRWQDCPIVFVTLPACPYCGTTGFITVRSEANGDGSVTRKSVCRRCSERFKLVIELPNSGNHDFDLP